MNDLFQGELTEADLVGYATHITGKLIESDTLAEQAEHNSVEQFAMGDYSKVLVDTVIDGQEQYSYMSSQVLDNERLQKEFADMILKQEYEGLRARRAKNMPVVPFPQVPPVAGDAAFAG